MVQLVIASPTSPRRWVTTKATGVEWIHRFEELNIPT
jgi:hypothetical protein